MFFPVNKLRNIALEYMKADFALVIDIDLMPSYDLESILRFHVNSGFFNSIVASIFFYFKGTF